jgi:hypothetical protein
VEHFEPYRVPLNCGAVTPATTETVPAILRPGRTTSGSRTDPSTDPETIETPRRTESDPPGSWMLRPRCPRHHVCTRFGGYRDPGGLPVKAPRPEDGVGSPHSARLRAAGNRRYVVAECPTGKVGRSHRISDPPPIRPVSKPLRSRPEGRTGHRCGRPGPEKAARAVTGAKSVGAGFEPRTTERTAETG